MLRGLTPQCHWAKIKLVGTLLSLLEAWRVNVCLLFPLTGEPGRTWLPSSVFSAVMGIRSLRSIALIVLAL